MTPKVFFFLNTIPISPPFSAAQLALATRVTNMKIDRFTMEYGAFSFKTSSLVADGEAVIVTFDYRKGKKAPVPDELRALFEKLQLKKI